MVFVLVELVVTLWSVLFHVVRGVVVTVLPFLVPKKDIAGRLVLVTGAGQGIGALMAKRIAQLGAKLILWDINAGSCSVGRECVNKMCLCVRPPLSFASARDLYACR